MRRAMIAGLVALGAAAVMSFGTTSEAAPTPGKVTTFTGVISSISTTKTGEFEALVKQGTKNYRVKSCGSKLVDQPLMLWAFQNKRLQYVTATSTQYDYYCFSSVLNSAP